MSNEFPASGTFDVPGTPEDFTATDFATAQEAFLAAAKHLLGGQSSIGTIAPTGGVLTPTQPIHFVDTEGAAATDTVESIAATNFRDGELLLLLPENVSHVVTYDGDYSAQMQLQGDADFVADATNKALLLVLNGASWIEVARTGWQPLHPKGKTLITASGNFTVPSDVYTIWVTAMGGGGGGGGGAGAGAGKANGGAGGAGGTTTFSTISVSGGAAGQGGGISGVGGAGGARGNNGQTNIPTDTEAAAGGSSPQTVLGGYGAGGAGGGCPESGGGGGSGGLSAVTNANFKKELSVTPGQVIAATIGAGGTAGAAGAGATPGTAGTAGTAGAVLVEW